MGNSTSQYERHEDDEQQQRLVINREFRLVLGQLDLSSDLIKSKKTLLNNSNGKQPRHRKISSSSSNSTITSSSSSDHPLSSISLVHLDIPTSSFDSNELDTHALLQYLLHHESYGKELSHLFRLPSTTTTASNPKSRSKSLPTAKIVAVYYDQPSTTNEFSIETIPLFNENEFEGKCQQFYHTSILSIYTSKSKAYLVSAKASAHHPVYELVRSTTMSKTALENFEWLHPFVNLSARGYRLCGLVPFVNSPTESSFTIYWLFERSQSGESRAYEHCIIEYQLKAASSTSWTTLLTLMAKQEWKLAATFDYSQKKSKSSEQTYFLLFFQKPKH